MDQATCPDCGAKVKANSKGVMPKTCPDCGAKMGGTAKSSFLVSSEYLTDLHGELPESVMFMPAGSSEISPSVNGQAKKISISVTRETADLLQSELDQLLRENVRPYIDFNHESGAAAAIPKRFTWRDGEGVYLELDWSGAGKNAVAGRDYSYFSPTFLLDESGHPAGLPASGAIGALTNNPAFRQIKKIAATTYQLENSGVGTIFNQPVTDAPKTKGDTMEGELDNVTAALRSEVETLRAENKKLIEAADQSKTDSEIELLKAENKQLKEAAEAMKVEAINREADLIIEAAVKEGRLAPKNEAMRNGLKKFFLVDAQAAKDAIAALPVNAAFKQVINVTAAHKDIGIPPAVKSNSSDGMNTGKACKSKVVEIQAQNKGMDWETAWSLAADRFPELFQSAN